MTTETEIRTGDDDMWWVEDHMKEFAQYQGQWIAVIGRKIVAAGADLEGVIVQVERLGLTDPFVTKIPADVHREVYFIG